MSRGGPGRVVAAALDPVLTAAGFAGAQYGDDRNGVRTQIIFCAAFDDFSDRYPALPQAGDQERDCGACVDLVIDVNGGGVIESVDLEGPSLEETLRHLDRTADADAIADLGGPLPGDLSILDRVLRRLFAVEP